MKKKKWIIIVVAVIIVFAIIGASGSNDEKDSKQTDNSIELVFAAQSRFVTAQNAFG